MDRDRHHPIASLYSNWRAILPKFGLLCPVLLLLAGCLPAAPQPTRPALASTLVLYNWIDYMPQSVLDAFEHEYGVKVIYKTFESAEEETRKILSAEVSFDVAVVDFDNLVELNTHHLLAPLDFHTLPNFKNVSQNFRDWQFDPGNAHSVPYNYGTTGLLVRTDLVSAIPRRWSDLWGDQYAGKIAIRAQPTEMISVALRSLGYPLNSRDPAQLQAAANRLQILKNNARIVGSDPQPSIQPLLDGEVTVMIGWNGDARTARDENPAIEYVLPAEGTMVWGDCFVISAKSQAVYTAELFLNFILRPEIGAEIVKAYFYPTTNAAVSSLLPTELSRDPLIYPSMQILSPENFYQPQDQATKKLYQDVWDQIFAP